MSSGSIPQSALAREKRRRYHKRYYQQNKPEILRQAHQRHDGQRQFVSVEELATCRQDPRQARFIRGAKAIVCLECGEILETLSRHLDPEHQLTAEVYKERWGCKRRTPLCSVELSRSSKELRKKRRLRPPIETQIGHGQPSAQHKRLGILVRGGGATATKLTPEQLTAHVSKRAEAQLAAMKGGWRLESRLNHRGKGIGPRPHRWKLKEGKAITDGHVAEQRLAGATMAEIARSTGLSLTAVSFRLRRMGFPLKHASVFLHGEPVTAELFFRTCLDFDVSRLAMVKKLGWSESWASHRLARSRFHVPLSVPFATRLIAERLVLLEGIRHRSATQQGGRPRMLATSDRNLMPTKYQFLLAELQALRRAVTENHLRLPQLWNWVCNRSRLTPGATLLMWPEFCSWLSDFDSLISIQKSKPSDLAIEFLAANYGVADETIRDAVHPGRRKNTETNDDTRAFCKTLLGVIGDRKVVGSNDLVLLLKEEDPDRWGTLDARRLAQLMLPHGLKPTKQRLGQATLRGYRRRDVDRVNPPPRT